MSAALFVPDYPDGACSDCGDLLSRGGRCPACLTFAHDLSLLTHTPAVFRSRPDAGAAVAYAAPACQPSQHRALELVAEGLTAVMQQIEVWGAAETRAYLSQLQSAVKEAVDGCPAGDACAWGGGR